MGGPVPAAGWLRPAAFLPTGRPPSSAFLEAARAVATPAYVIDRDALAANLAILGDVQSRAGCKILLATKAWAMPAAFPMMRDVLDGTTASGLYEARLGREEFGREVHVYAPAYTEAEVKELTGIADHIYFNSPEQIARFLPIVKARPAIEIGAVIDKPFRLFHVTLAGQLMQRRDPEPVALAGVQSVREQQLIQLARFAAHYPTGKYYPLR